MCRATGNASLHRDEECSTIVDPPDLEPFRAREHSVAAPFLTGLLDIRPSFRILESDCRSRAVFRFPGPRVVRVDGRFRVFAGLDFARSGLQTFWANGLPIREDRNAASIGGAQG
jgi:hypothetical protein